MNKPTEADIRKYTRQANAAFRAQRMATDPAVEKRMAQVHWEWVLELSHATNRLIGWRWPGTEN